jgi:type IV pilus assembly protein PilE
MVESPDIMVTPASHLACGNGRLGVRPDACPDAGLGPRRECGFTLIELMVAVSITGLLAALAFPSFRDHLVRNRATEATAALAEGRHQMEQYFFNQRTYAGGSCETSQTVGSFTLACPASGTGKPSATAYTIVATGSGLTSNLVYTIDQNGTQKTTSVPTGWVSVPTGGHPCWVLRRGSSC